MRMTCLRWSTILLPTAAIILVDYARHELMTGVGHTWWEEAALLVGVLLVATATSQLLFGRIAVSHRHQRQAETLRRIGIEIASSLELDKVLASVLARGRDVLEVDCLGVAMAASPSRDLMRQSRDSTSPERVPLPGGGGFLWEAIQCGQPRETCRDPTIHPVGPCARYRRCLAVPLKMGSQVLGALCVGSNAPGAFSPEERKLAEQVGNLASVAVANGLLHERAQNLATLEERDRIAREMHDSLAQVLGYLSMRCNAARDLLLRGEVARLEAELSEMGRLADEAYHDVREAILGLRESARAPGGLAEALGEYLEKFSRQSGVATRLTARENDSFDLPPRIEIQLVRVIQEALTNVRKHARAANAWVELERHDGGVRVSVGDDGQGFEPSSAEGQTDRGYGIATMRERLAGIGGQLAIESAPGRGTVVVATVPMAPQKGARDGEGQSSPGG